jgi:hypothetical protein
MNSNMSLGYKDLLFSFIQTCVNSYVSLETFGFYGFSKFLSTNILLFKECKYVAPQKLTFLVQNMTLKNDFNK